MFNTKFERVRVRIRRSSCHGSCRVMAITSVLDDFKIYIRSWEIFGSKLSGSEGVEASRSPGAELRFAAGKGPATLDFVGKGRREDSPSVSRFALERNERGGRGWRRSSEQPISDEAKIVRWECHPCVVGLIAAPRGVSWWWLGLLSPLNFIAKSTSLLFNANDTLVAPAPICRVYILIVHLLRNS